MSNYAKIHASGASVEYVLDLDPSDPSDAAKIAKRDLQAVPSDVEAGDLVTPAGIAPSPLPKAGDPPAQSPLPSAKVDAANADEYIAKCLTGKIDASSGVIGTLPEDMKIFVQAPVPDMPSANGTLLQNLPNYTHVVRAEGWVKLQNEDGFYQLGANTFSGNRGTGLHVGTDVAGLRSFNSDWREGGYFALIYIE